MGLELYAIFVLVYFGWCCRRPHQEAEDRWRPQRDVHEDHTWGDWRQSWIESTEGAWRQWDGEEQEQGAPIDGEEVTAGHEEQWEEVTADHEEQWEEATAEERVAEEPVVEEEEEEEEEEEIDSFTRFLQENEKQLQVEHLDHMSFCDIIQTHVLKLIFSGEPLHSSAFIGSCLLARHVWPSNFSHFSQVRLILIYLVNTIAAIHGFLSFVHCTFQPLEAYVYELTYHMFLFLRILLTPRWWRWRRPSSWAKRTWISIASWSWRRKSSWEQRT